MTAKFSKRTTKYTLLLAMLALLVGTLLALTWNSQKLKAEEIPAASTPYLDNEQYALLEEMLDTHLNYFIASGPITSHGLPLTAYKTDNPSAYTHSTPAEWGYSLQAWLVALDRGKLTTVDALTKFKTALNTIETLQGDANQNYGGLFYPFYWLLDETGNERPTPIHDPNSGIPSGDNAILYQSLLIVEGYLRQQDDAELAGLADRAEAIRQAMNFQPFVLDNGSSLFLSHLVDAETGIRSDGKWDVFADEGGLVAWVAYVSQAISWEQYQTATQSQMRRSSSWTSPCTGTQYTTQESAWFNAMFTWGTRSLGGFPAGDFDSPTGSASQFAARSFAPAVEAQLDYGRCILGVDYPITSVAPSQAEDGKGLVGRYTPPNLTNQKSEEAPNHVATHGPFVPFNIGPALSPTTVKNLISIITHLKTDAAGYYHDSGDHPFGLEVIASPYYDDTPYAGADQGRNVFETLNQAYIVLSLFNGLQLNDGKETLYSYAAHDPEYEIKVQQALQFLYPTPADPWCVVGDYTFGSDISESEQSPYPKELDVRIRADCVKPGGNTILLEAVQPAKAYHWLVWDSLALTSATGDSIWSLGQNEAPPDYTDKAFDEFDATLPFNIDFDADSMSASQFPFQLNDNALPQVYISFDLTAEQASRDLILNLDTLYATHDDVESFDMRVQVNGKGKTYTWPSEPPIGPEPDKPLVLIYAVLDNNLDGGWGRLVNNIEKGVRDDANIRLMVDAQGMDKDSEGNDIVNAFVYEPRRDENSRCPNSQDRTCGYSDGVNVWRFDTENTAHPASLYKFIGDSLLAYPNPEQLIVVLVGHGSGWGANVLPAQPSIWRDQDFAGGLLWDDTPDTPDDPNTSQIEGIVSLSLSSQSLGEALQWAGAEVGRPIDLLYLDACDMAMAEVAYEVRGSVNHLLASPNIAWASFNYDNLLPEVKDGRSGREIGEIWLAAEADKLTANPGHPHTFTLLDLDKMEPVMAAATGLADALRTDMAAARPSIISAHAAADRFDSDFDGALDTLDSYTDLLHFAENLQNDAMANADIRAAAQQVVTAVSETVVATDFKGGTPWSHPTQVWNWQRFGGLSVYLPISQDEARRSLFYNDENLAWAADTSWDEFLAAFWGDSASAVQSADGEPSMPVCNKTTDNCPGLPHPQFRTPDERDAAYLPLVWR